MTISVCTVNSWKNGNFQVSSFYRLVYVYLKHRKEDVLDQAAELMASCLRKGLGERVLGPDKPPVSRIQTLFIKKIVVKIELDASWPKYGLIFSRCSAS